MTIAIGIALTVTLLLIVALLRLWNVLRDRGKRKRARRRRIRNMAHAKAWFDVFQRPRIKRLADQSRK